MSLNIQESTSIAVIGYGSWATALVKILLENNHNVGWFIRKPEVIEYIKENGTNPRYLRDVHFDCTKLTMSDDLNYIVANYDILLMATPSAFLKSMLEVLTVPLNNKFIISAIKGIVPDEYITVAEYFNQHYSIPFDQIGIITGPSHAEEVALERLSYLTMVCKDIKTAEVLSKKFECDYIRVCTSTDIYGVEYAAILKNIYAIAVGIAVGIGYGDNFISVLIANGAIETQRFLDNTYPSPRCTNSSPYLGDLLVTTYSQFSRNRTFGMMLGKGYSVKSAQMEMSMIAEGYYSAYCIRQVNKRFGVDMPIAEAVYEILYEDAAAVETINKLTDKLI